MDFRTRRVAVSGAAWHLRELSAGAVEVLDPNQSEYTQALTLLALSLADDAGEARFPPEALDEGLAYVRGLPVSLVRDHLVPAATALNEMSLDDARGN